MLETIKKKRNISEPIDPLFKHFHSEDIQVIKSDAQFYVVPLLFLKCF